MTGGLLGHLVPASVAAVEAFADTDGAPHPDEEPLVARAVDKRRREFVTTRACARTALRRWVAEPGPILAEAGGAPIWPGGFVGSLTHCAGYRAAAVGRAVDVAAIGIDAEPHEPLPPEVVGAVMSPAEQAALDRHRADRPGQHWDRMLFSAKESTYKAWFPLTGRWLTFREAEVTFTGAVIADGPFAGGSFTSRLLVPGPVVGGVRVSTFEGRWRVGRGFLVTAIVVTAG
jgi:4'-phosphopantetheinyl transferase EntD